MKSSTYILFPAAFGSCNTLTMYVNPFATCFLHLLAHIQLVAVTHELCQFMSNMPVDCNTLQQLAV